MKKKRLKDYPELSRLIGKGLLIMRLSLILMVVGVLQSAASVYSQNWRMSMNEKSIVVKDVLTKIENCSEFRFFYEEKKVNVEKKVDVEITDATIDDIMNLLFNNEGVEYKVLDSNYIVLKPNGDSSSLSTNSSQQQKSVTGKVTDASGATLPGVSVVVKGTTIGVITDNNGSFSLGNIPDNAVLQFSFVGMKTLEVPFVGKKTINVSLVEETVGIEEVVAIGYGVQKKVNLTSSISKITQQSFESRPITNVGEAMAGQLAGVRSQNTSGAPGADLLIRIRGVNTINGSSEPLYVIDGVPKDNMSDINPSDIASIQILKDASATSIYGSRGSNGVVLIETKQGVGAPIFTFDSYFGLQQAEKKMDMMNKEEWLANIIWQRNIAWLRQGKSMKDPMSARPESLQIPNSWLDPNLKGTDWQDAIYTTAPIKNYQLSGSAKSKIGSIFISGGYLTQDGIVTNTYYKRTNFRFNGTLNVNKSITIGCIIAPSYSDKDARASEGKENVIHHAVTQSPLVQLNQATRDWGFPSGMGQAYPNPVEQLKETTDDLKKTSINNSVWGQWVIIKGLTFKTQFGYDYTNNTYEFYMPGNVTYNNGNVTMGNSYSNNYSDLTIQNTFVYDKKLGNHSFNFLAGQSAENHTFFTINAAASGWPNEIIRTLNVAKTPTQASTSKNRNTGMSYFGRVNYNFKDRYLLNTSIRYDGSSRFGSNQKWGLFPAISSGWKINEESFMKDIHWISLLKLRGAWGMAGNNRIGNYDYMAKLALENTTWAGNIVSGLAPSNVANDDLKWESTTTTDFGIDFTGFKNRIQLNLDYFFNRTNDLLFNVPIPSTSGFSNYRTNLGAVSNEGWEIDLKTVNTTGKVKWSSTINVSKEINEVKDMGGLTKITTTSWDAYFITKLGGPVSQFLAYSSNGLLSKKDFDANNRALVPILAGQEPGNIKYIDQNSDGKITTDDMIPQGSNQPNFLYGITNTVSWKNLELSALIQGQAGGKILFLAQRSMDAGGGNTNTLTRWLHQWRPDYEAIYGPGENPVPSNLGVDMTWDGKTPSTIGKRGDNNDDNRIYDASFVRIKSIIISYKMSQTVLSKTFIKSARIYASVDNLKTFTNYPGYNPENNSGGNTTTMLGVDYSSFPLSRRITFGINVTF